MSAFSILCHVFSQFVFLHVSLYVIHPSLSRSTICVVSQKHLVLANSHTCGCVLAASSGQITLVVYWKCNLGLSFDKIRHHSLPALRVKQTLRRTEQRKQFIHQLDDRDNDVETELFSSFRRNILNHFIPCRCRGGGPILGMALY